MQQSSHLTGCCLQVNQQVYSLAQSPNIRLPIGFLSGPIEAKSQYDNFHQLKAKDNAGKEVNFADLNGKVSVESTFTLDDL